MMVSPHYGFQNLIPRVLSLREERRRQFIITCEPVFSESLQAHIHAIQNQSTTKGFRAFIGTFMTRSIKLLKLQLRDKYSHAGKEVF